MRHLSRKKTINMNRFVFRADGSKFFPPNTTRPNKNFIGGIVGTTFDTRSAYDSMQLELRKRFKGGQQIVGSYTWSKSMDASAGDHGGSSGGVTATMDPFDWKRDWGLSSFHVKHNFSLSLVNDIPFPLKQGIAARALGGWQVASIVKIASGIPVNINNAGQFDQARAATFWIGDECGTQRPDLVTGKSNNPVIKNFDPNVSYLNTSSFRLQEAGTFGNLGRNTVIGPGLFVWDASLIKNHPHPGSRQRAIQSRIFQRSEFWHCNCTV